MEINADVIVELKNSLQIKGNLISTDKNLNLVLNNVSSVESQYKSYFENKKEVFIRGNTVNYIHFNPKLMDVNNL